MKGVPMKKLTCIFIFFLTFCFQLPDFPGAADLGTASKILAQDRSTEPSGASDKMLTWRTASWDGMELRLENGEQFIVQAPSEPEKSVRFFALDSEKTPFLEPRLEKECLVVDASRMKTERMENLTIQFWGLDPKRMGDHYMHFAEIQGPKGGKGRLFFEGQTREGRHFWKMLEIQLQGHRQIFAFEEFIPADLKTLFLRYDFTTPGEYRFFRSELRHEDGEKPTECVRSPELIFHVPFDGSAEACTARGDSGPRQEKGIVYVPGLNGKAAQFSSAADPLLEYPADGNLMPESGTISVWVRLNRKDAAGQEFLVKAWRTILANPFEDVTRIGSGALWYWIYEGKLRGDVSDLQDTYISRGFPDDAAWHHLVFTWNSVEKQLFIDGDRHVLQNRGKKANQAAPVRVMNFSRMDFETFLVGNFRGKVLEGVMDELRIYSAPLSQEEVLALYREYADVSCKPQSRYFFEDEPIRLDGKLWHSGKETKRLRLELVQSAGEREAESASEVLYSREILLTKAEEDYLAEVRGLNPGTYSVRILKEDGSAAAEYPIWVFHAENTTGQITHAPGTSVRQTKRNPRRLWYDDVDLKHIQTIRAVDAMKEGPEVFSQVGETRIGEAGGWKYLETAPVMGDRFAVRLNFPEVGKPYILELVFPDDKCRSADIIVQASKFIRNDYDLQVGYVTGDEYPTGHPKMVFRRCLYYPREKDSTLIVMNARNMPAGAALSEIRIYALDSPLPQARVTPAEPVNGWTRPVGIYFEDPAVGYDFGNFGYENANFETMLDRLCAYMKYSGQNMFSYPFVWYDGMIGEKYNPREHPPRCAEAFAKKFDREGLEFMATINQNNITFPVPAFTRSDIHNGRLGDSIFTIHSTGTPHPGGWHDSPPIFNILHPDVQKMVLQEVDELLDLCADHPSFKGIVLHLPMHSLNSLGDIRTGYNDYMIRDFEKETGILVDVDKTDPMRGKLFYEWLMKNAREEWVDWRCRKLTAWYAVLAKRLADRRADLKLGIHCITPILYAHTVYDEEEGLRDFWLQVNRDMGIDSRYLAKIPNVFVEQSVFPADYRWMHGRKDERLRERLRLTEETRGMYASLLDAPNAWVHHFDRYWESDIAVQEERGGKPNRFPADWLKECTWRVTTLNPAGHHAMKHYVMPLRYKDIQGISKGGFLIGTYGMESKLIPFVQAFRALPAVEFADVLPKKPLEKSETVKVRRYSDGKETWFYVVNTDAEFADVTLRVPSGELMDLASGRSREVKKRFELRMKPYQLCSFRMAGDVSVEILDIR